MLYLDSAYIVKCYLQEPGSAEVLGLVEGKTELTCCAHGRVEVRAAIKRHQREGQLSALASRRVLARLGRDEVERIWTFVPVTAELVQAACERLERLPASVVIRSADALHLTCARELGAREIYSSDRHLLSAAVHFGLQGRNVIS